MTITPLFLLFMASYGNPIIKKTIFVLAERKSKFE
jgi:hypothetical protein